jgi:hypothetical protein
VAAVTLFWLSRLSVGLYFVAECQNKKQQDKNEGDK